MWDLWFEIGPRAIVAWLPVLTAAVLVSSAVLFSIFYLAGLGTHRPMLKCAVLAGLIELALILILVQLPEASAGLLAKDVAYSIEIHLPNENEGAELDVDLTSSLSTSAPVETSDPALPADVANPQGETPKLEEAAAPSVPASEPAPAIVEDPSLVLPPTPLEATAPPSLQAIPEAAPVDLAEPLSKTESDQPVPTQRTFDPPASETIEPALETDYVPVAPSLAPETREFDRPTIEVAPLSPPVPAESAPQASAAPSPEAQLSAQAAPLSRPTRMTPTPSAAIPAPDVPALPAVVDMPKSLAPEGQAPPAASLPGESLIASAPPKASTDQQEPASRFDLRENLSRSSPVREKAPPPDRPSGGPMPVEPDDEISALIARARPADLVTAPTVDPKRFWENRTAPDRLRIVYEHGGSEATERAVAMALAWLAAHQSDDGRWDSDGFDQKCPAGDQCTGHAIENSSDSGLTGLALLAFLGAGHTHAKASEHQETVRKGLSWLIRVQRPDGDLQFGGRIYAHAMATLALTEAFAMTGDERLREPAQRAIVWLSEAQHAESGSWRYAPRQFGDTSVHGWAVLALRSARSAGLNVPASTWRLARKWLPMVSSGARGGLACYRPGYPPSHAMTAEALFCRHVFGAVEDPALLAEAADYVLSRLPDAEDYHIYYWYYGTLALFPLGDERWQRWNDRLTATLLSTQVLSGHAAGSWNPQRPFGVDGGRIFSTAASALCLEVYYRYLPIYSTDTR